MGLFKLIGKLFVPVKSETPAPEPENATDPDNVLGGKWETPPDILALESDIHSRDSVKPDPVAAGAVKMAAKKKPAKKKKK